MLTKMQKVAFWVAILGAGKLVAQIAGYEIPDQVINDVANGLAAIASVVGIVLDHGADNNTTS
jgi:uncharacterized membrane protein